MVDSSGYSTAIKEKYQAYLLNEVTLEIGGQTLKPGAYGIGFLNGGKFVVMDLGANDVLQAASQHDAEMKRPVPLQVLASATAGKKRVYAGLRYLGFRPLKLAPGAERRPMLLLKAPAPLSPRNNSIGET